MMNRQVHQRAYSTREAPCYACASPTPEIVRFTVNRGSGLEQYDAHLCASCRRIHKVRNDPAVGASDDL